MLTSASMNASTVSVASLTSDASTTSLASEHESGGGTLEPHKGGQERKPIPKASGKHPSATALATDLCTSSANSSCPDFGSLFGDVPPKSGDGGERGHEQQGGLHWRAKHSREMLTHDALSAS